VSRHIKGWARGNGFSLLSENDKDVKTVQSLMRHANGNITMNIYTHAVTSKKRQPQSKVVEMIRGSQKRQSRRESLSVYFLM
jgi:integrase